MYGHVEWFVMHPNMAPRVGQISLLLFLTWKGFEQAPSFKPLDVTHIILL